MDKGAWLQQMAPLARAFANPTHKGKRLEAYYGSLVSKYTIGRSAFQNIYDLISSWPCWDLNKQESAWETKILFELQPSQIASPVSENTKYYIETDEQCVKMRLFSVTQVPTVNVDLVLKSTPDVKEFSRITAKHVLLNDCLFKVSSSAFFSNAVVIKRKVFELNTHFHWEYEFTLTWAAPYVEDREASSDLVFKQDPKCGIKVICQPLQDNSEHFTEEYIAESLIYKIHESVPSNYRSSDGTSVSLSSNVTV